MKTITRRPSTSLSRAILAAFLISLPGSREAFAQVTGRVGAAGMGSGVSAQAGAALGGLTSAPGLSVPLSPMNLSLSAPSVGAPAPVPAPAALTPAALRPAALAAAIKSAPVANEPRADVHAVPPFKAPRALVALVPGAQESAAAIDSLIETAGESKDDGHGPSSGQRFDGNRRRASGADDGDGKGGDWNRGALVPGALPAEAPVLALNKIFFPGVNAVRFSVKDPAHIALVAKAVRDGGHIIITSVGADSRGNSPAAVLAILSQAELSDPSKASVRMTVLRTATIAGYKEVDGVATAQVTYPKMTASDEQRLNDLGSLAQHTLDELAPLDKALDKDLLKFSLMEKSPERLANFLAQDFPFTSEVKHQLLQETSTEALLQAVILEMTAHFKTKMEKPKAAAPGSGTSVESLVSLEAFTAKLKAIGMPAAIQENALKEYNNLAQMNPKDPDAQKVRTYILWLLDVPWSKRTADTLDIVKARQILDKDHSGLEKVKMRVLRYLALRKRTGSKKGAIIAFTGPPGVGKTSIASAIAESLGRKFVRLSLGGVHDESVLRGHGRTYQGSMPGEIMRLMKTAGSINPVMLLDEVDKIGKNGNAGDPTAALLEILDPKQNNTYRDRYIGEPYDLSEVLFVITANDLSAIPEPLRNRMEIIEFSGYTTLEKIEIAERHIIPNKLKEVKLDAADAPLSKDVLRKVIEGYTMEAGVRTLEQRIGELMTMIATWADLTGEKAPPLVDDKDIVKYLGVPDRTPRQTAQNGVGVATGLAVNAYGGSTLNVEVSQEPGTGQLKLRKQFGDDIDDSAKNAYKYVKQNAAKFGLEKVDFTKIDLDINITPAGKVDGPSAGGLMVTAIISALTGRPVAPGLAMTGEITMRGDILPIGGLKQKVMAAHRMGYKQVIFPFANLKDIEDIPAEVRQGIVLTAVQTYDEIYPEAIVPAAPETAQR